MLCWRQQKCGEGVYEGAKMPKQKVDPPRVFLVWLDDDNELHTLAYDSGKGEIRVYYKDHYDPRATLGLPNPIPYFSNASEAMIHIGKNRGQKGMCQVHVKNAVKFGYKWSELMGVEYWNDRGAK
jgi:hypothetical protein